MHTRKLLFIPVVFLFACAQRQPAAHAPQSSSTPTDTIETSERDERPVCVIHHLQLHSATVPVTPSFGYPSAGLPDDYRAAAAIDFPNAAPLAAGSCTERGARASLTATVMHCPTCVAARDVWLAQHPTLVFRHE